jgi:hypothetical protein
VRAVDPRKMGFCGVAIEDVERVVLKGCADENLCGIWIDGSNAGEGDIVGGVKEWGKGQVCGSKEEKRVYQDIGSIEGTRAGWEGQNEDSERESGSSTDRWNEIESEDMEQVESR